MAEENYFRYARTHFALDALNSHAATPDDPGQLVPNPAKKAAAAQVRHAEVLAAAAEAERDASLAALRNPAPGQPVTITNQMINALDAPVQAAWPELQAAQDAAAAVPARIRLGVFPLFWTPDQAANWLSCLYPSSYSPGVKYPSAECLRTRL